MRVVITLKIFFAKFIDNFCWLKKVYVAEFTLNVFRGTPQKCSEFLLELESCGSSRSLLQHVEEFQVLKASVD